MEIRVYCLGANTRWVKLVVWNWQNIYSHRRTQFEYYKDPHWQTYDASSHSEKRNSSTRGESKWLTNVDQASGVVNYDLVRESMRDMANTCDEFMLGKEHKGR